MWLVGIECSFFGYDSSQRLIIFKNTNQEQLRFVPKDVFVLHGRKKRMWQTKA